MDLKNLASDLLNKAEEAVGGNVSELVEQAKEKASSVVSSEQVDEVVNNVKDKFSDTIGSLFNK